jgi:hypothetical protein
MRNTLPNLIFLLYITLVSCSTSNLYAEILNDFVELNSEVGNGSEDLGVHLANVRNIIQSQEKSNNNFFQGLHSTCTSGAAKINEFLAKLTNDINESTNALNNWRKDQEKANVDIKSSEGSLKANAQKITENGKRLKNLAEDFKLAATETDQKITVVKMLRDIITDELLNTKRPGSFLQLSKFQEKLNELKGMLNNDNDSLYSPIVSVLLELASEQNFSDQGILKKILDNINNLDKSLHEFRQRKEAELKSGEKSLRDEETNLQNIRKAYRNMKAQAMSKRIDAQHYLQFFTNEIAHFNAEKKRKEDERDLFAKICAYQDHAEKESKKSLEDFKNKVLPMVVDEIQKLK